MKKLREAALRSSSKPLAVHKLKKMSSRSAVSEPIIPFARSPYVGRSLKIQFHRTSTRLSASTLAAQDAEMASVNAFSSKLSFRSIKWTAKSGKPPNGTLELAVSVESTKIDRHSPRCHGGANFIFFFLDNSKNDFDALIKVFMYIARWFCFLHCWYVLLLMFVRAIIHVQLVFCVKISYFLLKQRQLFRHVLTSISKCEF